MSEISPEAQAAAAAAQQAVENVKTQEQLAEETANAELAATIAEGTSKEAFETADTALAVSVESAVMADEAANMASAASIAATQANENATNALSETETLRDQMAAGFAGIHALFRERTEDAQNANVEKVPANVGTTANQDTGTAEPAGQSNGQSGAQTSQRQYRHRFGRRS